MSLTRNSPTTTTPPQDFQVLTDNLIASCIGKPWQILGRGPDSFDCWGFVRFIAEHGLGLSFPDFPYVIESDGWAKTFDKGLSLLVARPSHKAEEIGPYGITFMGKGPQISHVAVSHYTGYLYHCTRGLGVVGHTRLQLSRFGFSIFDTYSPKVLCGSPNLMPEPAASD